jgi:hypothetical protein
MKKEPYHIVRNSKIHGKGVFAKRPIRKGTQVIEYDGDIITVDEADEIGIKTEKGHSHTMFFTVDKNRVINGNTGGDAKYINHSCDPNCETVQYGDKIMVEALRSIPKGQELTYDYHLEVEEKITDKVLKEYACFCGSPNCRGTQIAASLLKKYKKKLAKKEKKAARKAEKKKAKKEKKAARKAEKAKAKLEEKQKQNAPSPNADKKKSPKNKKAKNKN